MQLFTYKVDHGAKWLKIFNQKAPNLFSKSSDARFSIVDGLFSILSLITEKHRIHGKYEFLLEYPGEEGYNRWLQTNFPLNENLNSDYVEGFEALNISWPCIETTSPNNNETFFGLGLSNTPSSALIDGTDYYWYFAIGQVSSFLGSSIAGYKYGSSTLEVLLWLRVVDIDCSKELFGDIFVWPILISLTID